jgi:hypothetical protein
MHKLEKGMTPARTSTLLSILCFAGALGATAIASPALAHHSFAVYDHTKKVTLEGTVKDWVFANPHSSLTLVVMENGAPVEYLIEGASVNTLIRMGGWSPATFKPGDKITVVMNPMRNSTTAGAFIRATLPDGKVINGGQQAN